MPSVLCFGGVNEWQHSDEEVMPKCSKPASLIYGVSWSMNEDGVRVTKIDWLSAIPSLRLFEAVRLAFSLRIVMPVLLLMLLSSGGTKLFARQLEKIDSEQAFGRLLNVSELGVPDFLDTINRSLKLIAVGTWSQFLMATLLLVTWMLMFAFCGIAAMRTAGYRFCSGSGCGVLLSVKYSLGSWKPILVSSLLTGILLGLLCSVFWLMRWVGDSTHAGVTAIASLLQILGCLVLGTGWLLSLAGIAIDGCDGAEALSRGISYILSRWLRVIVYSSVICLAMTTCNTIIMWITDNAYLLTALEKTPNQSSVTGAWSALEQLAEMIRLSIFLCGISIGYVLLRNVEDGVSLREMQSRT